MTKILLTQGKFALISNHQYERVRHFSWRATWSGKKWYASTLIDGKTVYLHRFIAGVTDTKTQVDHKDGDGLNCQDYNLRTCSNKQNSRNSIAKRARFKGVCWLKKNRKYRARIMVDGKEINLGCFDDEVSAAHAYDTAARKYFGDFAWLNFKELAQS
jgi:hypothetical protein